MFLYILPATGVSEKYANNNFTLNTKPCEWLSYCSDAYFIWQTHVLRWTCHKYLPGHCDRVPMAGVLGRSEVPNGTDCPHTSPVCLLTTKPVVGTQQVSTWQVNKHWPRIRLVSTLPTVSGKRTGGVYLYKLHCSHDMASTHKLCFSNVPIVRMWSDGATYLWSYRDRWYNAYLDPQG